MPNTELIRGVRVPIAEGVRRDEDGAGWQSWWLFSPPLSREQYLDFCDREDLCRYYGGPGEAYSNHPGVRSSRSYSLVEHSGGLDT